MYDRLVAKDPVERFFCAIGVPREHWHAKVRGLKFAKTPFGGDTVSAAGQRQILKATVQEPRRQFLVISSTPTDRDAQHAAFAITIALARRENRVAILDLQNPWEEPIDSPKVITMHNCLANCTDARAQMARDILIRNTNKIRILVTNAKDPYNWSCTKLGLRPSGVALIVEAD